MPYPSLLEYNEALQAPTICFNDPILKNGQIKLTGLGFPLAMCGGFALTYTISSGSKKYAVRCFQRESPNLQIRYNAISNKLKSLNSDYFVDFEYQPKGITINECSYPIVKMDWAQGETLGEYIERYHNNVAYISRLIPLLTQLSTFLEVQRIAHGDIQPGNVMVSNTTVLPKLQLIDYDGMYVETLSNLGSSELGLKNFQHPGRTSEVWDRTLDRFSFIALNLALRAIIALPDIWGKTQSDSETIIFTANDYLHPETSAIFAELFSTPQLSEDAKNFAKICISAFNKVPSLKDFLCKWNIPEVQVASRKTISYSEAPYSPSCPVLAGTDYSGCAQHIGERVELIGKITEVKSDRARNGKPYIFLNFGYWRNDIVKIAIWSDSLSVFESLPDKSWTDRWVSVIGLLEKPYPSPQHGYTHISINITQRNQIHFITPVEANRRLAARMAGGTQPTPFDRQVAPPSNTSLTKNQQISQQMKRSSSSSQTQSPPSSTPLWTQTPKSTSGTQPSKAQTSSSNCYIATALYGLEDTKTEVLRQYRDRVLLKTKAGRLFVKGYYATSPALVPVITNSKTLNRIVRAIIDKIVCKLQENR
jgi:hypothetical protein